MATQKLYAGAKLREIRTRMSVKRVAVSPFEDICPAGLDAKNELRIDPVERFNFRNDFVQDSHERAEAFVSKEI